MATLQDIRRRINTVKNIQQITKAMYMVAASKLRRAQQDAESARPYAESLEELISNVMFRLKLSDEGGVVNPLLEEREINKAELLLFTSDRGLCGSFNNNLISKAVDFMKEKQGEIPEINLSVVGKKSRDYFRKKTEMRKIYMDWERGLSFSLAREIADDLMEQYTSSEVDAVYLIYPVFVSAIVQKPTLVQLLPFPVKEQTLEVVPVDFIYEPSPDVLVNELLPRQVRVQVFRALMETRASEHAARMASMDQATNNAGDMIDSLTMHMNKVRQETITKELLDIVVGAEALKK
jgi:F-type H+-transporting ATPase subunit gamma